MSDNIVHFHPCPHCGANSEMGDKGLVCPTCGPRPRGGQPTFLMLLPDPKPVSSDPEEPRDTGLGFDG